MFSKFVKNTEGGIKFIGNNSYILAAFLAIIFAAIEYSTKEEENSLSAAGILGVLTVPLASMIEIFVSKIAVMDEIPIEMRGNLKIEQDDATDEEIVRLQKFSSKHIEDATNILKETLLIEVVATTILIAIVAGIKKCSLTFNEQGAIGLAIKISFYVLEAGIYGYNNKVLEDIKEDCQKEFRPQSIRSGFKAITAPPISQDNRVSPEMDHAVDHRRRMSLVEITVLQLGLYSSRQTRRRNAVANISNISPSIATRSRINREGAQIIGEAKEPSLTGSRGTMQRVSNSKLSGDTVSQEKEVDVDNKVQPKYN